MCRRHQGAASFVSLQSDALGRAEARPSLNGGETKLSNLINLCHFHHHCVHDGGYRVEGQWPFASGCHNAHWFWGQCVVYDGPDPDHQGQQICFAANEDTLTIVDVTDKAQPVQLSRTGYAQEGYTHQAWLD